MEVLAWCVLFILILAALSVDRKLSHDVYVMDLLKSSDSRKFVRNSTVLQSIAGGGRYLP